MVNQPLPLSPRPQTCTKLPLPPLTCEKTNGHVYFSPADSPQGATSSHYHSSPDATSSTSSYAAATAQHYHGLRFIQPHHLSLPSGTSSPNVLESSDSSTISPGTTVSGSTVMFNRNETHHHHQAQQLPPPLQPLTINKLSSFDDFLYADCSPLEENTQNNNINKTNPFNNSSEES